jgi:pimeloyl-ACP methyl ester carboxylesterase
MTNSSYYFRRLMPGLTGEFRVIAPHFRGMGFSERVAYVPPGAWLEDVIALMDEVGVGSAHFYGVSLGALIGMRLAIEQPARVRTLTLDSPNLGLDAIPPTIGTEPNNQPPPWIVAELRAMHGDDWETVVRNCDAYLRTPEILTYLSIGELAADIGAPTLIVRGDIDEPVHPLAHAMRLRQLIPRSRLWIAPDTASLVTRQSPQESLRVFCDFVLDVSALPPDRVGSPSPELIELLSQVEVFAGLRRSAVARFAALATTEPVRRGAIVFREGEPADDFYVVAHGVFGVTARSQDGGGELTLRPLRPGAFFGELALISNAPHLGTVHCEADGELVRIDGKPVRALLQRDASASMAVASAITRYARAHGQVPSPSGGDHRGR